MLDLLSGIPHVECGSPHIPYWYNALGHGLLTSLAGAVSYGVGGVAAQIITPNGLLKNAFRKYVQATFAEPFSWSMDLIKEYLL